MDWVVRYYIYQANLWEVRQKSNLITPGAVAYAARQHFRWKDIAASAKRRFKVTIRNHNSGTGAGI